MEMVRACGSNFSLLCLIRAYFIIFHTSQHFAGKTCVKQLLIDAHNSLYIILSLTSVFVADYHILPRLKRSFCYVQGCLGSKKFSLGNPNVFLHTSLGTRLNLW